MKHFLLIFTLAIMFSSCTKSDILNEDIASTTLLENKTSDVFPQNESRNNAISEKTVPVQVKKPVQVSVRLKQPISLKNKYIEKIADELLEKIITKDMTDIQKIHTVYEYLIVNTYFQDPIGLDVWQYRSEDKTIPPYIENRAISPILFGIGTCEDYASAMAILCMRMGYEAQYVFGMTVSIEGDYVDHAWTVVNVNEKWYHLDPQLEDNIVRNGQIKNRYFMRCDSVMILDHKWGQNLIDFRSNLSQEQKSYIKKELMPPICNGEVPPQPAYYLKQASKPNKDKILSELKKEKIEFEKIHGKAEKVKLNIKPPMEINP